MATIFVLGSRDVEMVCIREIVEEAGFCCVQAGLWGTLPNGALTFVPVGPGQAGTIIARITCGGAYDVVPIHPDDTYLGVEVAGPWGPAFFDHHDNHPNASLPPSKFLRASSLGQVIVWLGDRGLLPTSFGSESMDYSGSSGFYSGLSFEYDQWCYVEGVEYRDCCCCADMMVRIIPPRYVAQAAADHCLSAAFAGQCPGVDLTPGSPMYNEVVLSRRQAFAPDMSDEDFLDCIETAADTLRYNLAARHSCRAYVPPTDSFADLTHRNPATGPIAPTGEQYPAAAQFLPLVGSMIGIGYIVPCNRYTIIKNDDGTTSFVNPVRCYRLGGCGVGTPAGTAPIEWWRDIGYQILGCYGPDESRPNNMYANPARGFGGGTVKCTI